MFFRLQLLTLNIASAILLMLFLCLGSQNLNKKQNQPNKNIPPPPPLPQFKKYDPKIKIIKKKKIIKKPEKHFDVPTIEELQTILSNLKNHNLRENKI